MSPWNNIPLDWCLLGIVSLLEKRLSWNNHHSDSLLIGIAYVGIKYLWTDVPYNRIATPAHTVTVKSHLDNIYTAHSEVRLFILTVIDTMLLVSDITNRRMYFIYWYMGRSTSPYSVLCCIYLQYTLWNCEAQMSICVGVPIIYFMIIRVILVLLGERSRTGELLLKMMPRKYNL